MVGGYMRHGFGRSRTLDIDGLLGIIGGIGLVTLSIAIGGGITQYIDGGAMLIVFGGTLGATLVRFPFRAIRSAIAQTIQAFSSESGRSTERFIRIVDLAKRSRSENLLGLQAYIYREGDPFFRKCLELLTDGLQPEELRKMVTADLSHPTDANFKAALMFQSMAATAPAMGLIGTIIGLVQMLRQLSDPASLGPAMAIAMLTTLYGVITAHMICYPLANKLMARSEEERLLREMTIDGVASIAEGMNHRLIEERLTGFVREQVNA